MPATGPRMWRAAKNIVSIVINIHQYSARRAIKRCGFNFALHKDGDALQLCGAVCTTTRCLCARKLHTDTDSSLLSSSVQG